MAFANVEILLLKFGDLFATKYCLVGAEIGLNRTLLLEL